MELVIVALIVIFLVLGIVGSFIPVIPGPPLAFIAFLLHHFFISQFSLNLMFLVALIGLLSGLAPDLDIFIRSSDDPLLFLEFHRQFTHSLVFIPFGGLICGAFIFLIVKKISTLTFKETYIYSTIGYATHGLLDACTSYGTLLF